METRGVERAVWLGLGAVVGAVVLVGLWSALGGREGDTPPPVLGALPDFTLTERSGRPIGRDELSGQPWVADFIFTRCSSMCPALSTRMAALRRELRTRGVQARLVSFTVDPSHDTPEVLRAYAARYAADDDWLFLTGDRDALYALIGEGFRLSVAERPPDQADDGGDLITHSDRFVLVDGEGRVRGYYHATEPDGMSALLRDVAKLQPRS